MKRFELCLQDEPIGTVKIDSVRGRETWMYASLKTPDIIA